LSKRARNIATVPCGSYSPDMLRTWCTPALMLTAVSLVFSLSVLPQIQPNGQACDGDCLGRPPACQNTWQPYVSAVFLGRTTEVRKEDVPITLDGEKKLTEKLLVTFLVKEAFVGVSEKVLTVSSGGDMCAFPFSKGHEYLVFARRLSGGELYVSTCYGTNFAEYAADDLNYLRSLPNAPHGSTVFGTAFQFTEPERLDTKMRRLAPESGHRVTVRGLTQNYESLVDEKGNFTLGLPPGHYTVSLDSNGEVSTFPAVRSTTVDIADKGCARFNFYVDPFAESTGQTCIFDFDRGETSNCIRQATTGELFIAPQVLRELEFDSYGLAPVLSLKEGWMYVSRRGIVVVQRVQTMDNGPDSFHDGLVRVIRNKKYGFANRKGELVIPPVYDGAMSFENGKAKVCKGCDSKCADRDCEHHFLAGGEWFQIDTKGSVVARIQPGN
jgi:hypothetical protein